MPLTLRLFGRFSCRIGEGDLSPLRSRRGYLLFALLILRGGRKVSREEIIALLWPESSFKGGQENLRRTLTDLRRALGLEAFRVVSDGHQSLSFLVDSAVFADVLRFDALAARWDITGNDDSATEAVELHRGPLLEEWDVEGVAVERDIRSEQCRAMLESLARTALLDNNTNQALALARRAERLAPLSSPIQCLLFEAILASGESTGAEIAYRRFRDRLHREANQQPDSRTQAEIERLRQRYLHSKPSPSTTGRSDNRPGLPHFLTSFIGRVEDIQSVRNRLLEANTRLVTLMGVGGIGKTRLAVEVASRMGESVYVDLSVLTTGASGEIIWGSVLAALGGKATDGSARESVALLLNRPILLVFDNAEHLLPAVSRVICEILNDAHSCQILATSRRSLRVPGEVCWRLSPHDDPISLFAARARAVRPEFTLTEENQASITELCRRLDDLPLAIELAAARLRLLPIQKIAERLSNRFDLLASDILLISPRQRTLRSTIAWSYELLDSDEKDLLAALSVFMGGASLEAVEAVAPAFASRSSPLDILSRLVDSSLVVPGERYRLLETVRDYAAECLKASGKADELSMRHYEYLLSLARDGDKHAWGDDSAYYFDLLESERENFRAAILNVPGENALILTLCLSHFWNQRGYFRDGVILFRLAFDRCSNTEEPILAILLAQARGWQGRFQRALGQKQDAEGVFREAISLCRVGGDLPLLTDMLNCLGSLLHEQGNLLGAWECYQEGLMICHDTGDHRRTAILRRETGILLQIEGNYVASRKRLQEALAMFRAENARWDEMVCLWWLGFVCEAQGDFQTAMARLDESLIYALELRSPAAELMVRQSQADVLRDQGDFALARECYEATMPLAREVGDWYKEAVAWRGMSEASRGLGDGEGAADYIRRAVTLASRSHAPLLCALELLSEAAAVATFMGLVNDAVSLYAFVEYSRASRKIPNPATVRDRHSRDIAALNFSLGESNFAQLWQQGKNMPIENAFALVRI